MGTIHNRYWHSTKRCQYRYWHYTLVQYQYEHVSLPVLASQHGASTGTGIFTLWFSTGIGTVHYRYWQSVVPIPVMANMYLESVPVWAQSITGTKIQLCLYQYWHFCTLIQYQYWHGPLLVLALNGASTSIGIFALLSNTSIGTVRYRYCHYLVSVPVLAFWYFGSVSVLAWSITGTGIKWCQYRYLHICTFVQYQYWHGTLPVLPLLGASTGNGILVLWFSISIGMVHYQYWH
jgi:hypothetical protein